MAHEFESGFFVSQPAWHGLGVTLPNAPSIDQAITQAGLDWQAEKRPLFLGNGTQVPDTHAVIRSTDGAYLGSVGSRYTILQNTEAFAFFAPFVDSGAVTLETAGSLRGGRRVWVMAKTQCVGDVVPGDAVTAYLLLSNSHDGSLSVRVGFTPIRVVCANTLAAAHSSGGSRLLKLKHTARVKDTLDLVRDTMDTVQGTFNASVEQYKAMAAQGVDKTTLEAYVRRVFNIPGNERKSKVLESILENFEAGRGHELAGTTVWGAYNSVTEYITHQRGNDSDRRLDSQWFGPGAELIQTAMTEAMALL